MQMNKWTLDTCPFLFVATYPCMQQNYSFFYFYFTFIFVCTSSLSLSLSQELTLLILETCIICPPTTHLQICPKLIFFIKSCLDIFFEATFFCYWKFHISIVFTEFYSLSLSLSLRLRERELNLNFKDSGKWLYKKHTLLRLEVWIGLRGAKWFLIWWILVLGFVFL